MDKRTNNENLKYVDQKLPFVQNLKNVTQIIVAGAISLRDKLHAEPNYVQCVSHSKYRGRFHAMCESLCMKMQISCNARFTLQVEAVSVQCMSHLA